MNKTKQTSHNETFTNTHCIEDTGKWALPGRHQSPLTCYFLNQLGHNSTLKYVINYIFILFLIYIYFLAHTMFYSTVHNNLHYYTIILLLCYILSYLVLHQPLLYTLSLSYFLSIQWLPVRNYARAIRLPIVLL